MGTTTLGLTGSGAGYGSGYGSGSGDGSGYGYGSGDGDGGGYGYGYGDGGGYGDGYGYGSGYGSGDGSGVGSGYGSGYVSGSGYGSGDGSGAGYGDGDGDAIAEAYAEHPTVQKAKQDGSDLVLAIWRSDEHGRPTNGGDTGIKPVKPGTLQEVPGPLKICSRGLHGTTSPHEWSGDRWWVVALFEPVQRQGDKIASLKRLIIEELS